ncbi:DNA binding protein [Aureococcus anophagefferens]|nr:DNA binding protein [Aureococcus anophagefferens]
MAKLLLLACATDALLSSPRLAARPHVARAPQKRSAVEDLKIYRKMKSWETNEEVVDTAAADEPAQRPLRGHAHRLERRRRIVVADPSRRAEVCPKFFRHKNWNSFSRMLNMYEFHKVPAGAHGAQVHVVEFRHAAFRRGGGADLWTIVRKKAKAPADGAAARASPKRPRAAAKPKRAAQASPPASVARPRDARRCLGGGGPRVLLRDVFAASVAEAGAPDALALRPALGFDPMDLDDVPHHASPGFMAQIHDFVASSTCCARPRA